MFSKMILRWCSSTHSVISRHWNVSRAALESMASQSISIEASHMCVESKTFGSTYRWLEGGKQWTRSTISSYFMHRRAGNLRPELSVCASGNGNTRNELNIFSTELNWSCEVVIKNSFRIPILAREWCLWHVSFYTTLVVLMTLSWIASIKKFSHRTSRKINKAWKINAICDDCSSECHEGEMFRHSASSSYGKHDLGSWRGWAGGKHWIQMRLWRPHVKGPRVFDR